MVSWEQLLELDATLRQWCDDARSVARNARWNWYGRWIAEYGELRRHVNQVAEQRGMDARDVHRAAVRHLVDVYETERSRVARHGNQKGTDEGGRRGS